MKKLASILAATILSVSVSSVNAEMLSFGISANGGILDATGKETFNSKTRTKSDEIGMAYVSGFAELHLPIAVGPGNIRVGLSYVPYALESEATSSARAEGESHSDLGDSVINPKAAFNQKVQVDIEDLRSMYLSYHLDMFFLKAGYMEADLITNEVLGSGSAYGNAKLEGTFMAIGFDKPLTNSRLPDGMFIRGEVSASEFDSISLTSTGSDNTNVIDISGIDGTNVAFSVGRSF
ncbi:hypothetical protein N8841_01260 [Candidatus Pelagibacter sp.]|nr:hypothetical protein [Candidatus Pelagibacter sp.]